MAEKQTLEFAIQVLLPEGIVREMFFFSAFGRCRAADSPPGPTDVACPRLDAAELQIPPRARQMLLVKTFGSWLCGRLRPFVCDCVFVCVARDLATVIDFSFLAAWSLKAKCVRKRVAFLSHV